LWLFHLCIATSTFFKFWRHEANLWTRNVCVIFLYNLEMSSSFRFIFWMLCLGSIGCSCYKRNVIIYNFVFTSSAGDISSEITLNCCQWISYVVSSLQNDMSKNKDCIRFPDWYVPTESSALKRKIGLWNNMTLQKTIILMPTTVRTPSHSLEMVLSLPQYVFS
jgi:hypothetical protein